MNRTNIVLNTGVHGSYEGLPLEDGGIGFLIGDIESIK